MQLEREKKTRWYSTIAMLGLSILCVHADRELQGKAKVILTKSDLISKSPPQLCGALRNLFSSSRFLSCELNGIAII